jgi:F420-dependent oxidoreductase-like protein
VQIEPQFGFSYERIRDIARAAHQAGFTRLWVSDHLLLNREAVATDCLEAWTLLAALARDTEGIRIGPMVTAQSYRNPALLAKIAAGVDHMSGGRLEFGLGAGWKEVEYAQYGYAFPEAGVRVTQLVEALEICTRLWRDDRATFHGEHYRVDDAVCAPKPLQRPLPIWIGGSKPRVMRIAARYAQWFNVTILPGRLADRIASLNDGLEAACRAERRDPRTLGRSMFLYAIPGKTRAAVDAMVEEVARRQNTTREKWFADRPGAIVGTIDEIAGQFRELRAGGVDHGNVMFPYQYELEAIEALAPIASER